MFTALGHSENVYGLIVLCPRLEAGGLIQYSPYGARPRVAPAPPPGSRGRFLLVCFSRYKHLLLAGISRIIGGLVF